MPTDRSQGGCKIAVIAGVVLAFGLALGILCIASSVPHPGNAAGRGVHKERSDALGHGEGDTLVVDTTPAPSKAAGHREKEQHHAPLLDLNRTNHSLGEHNATNLTKDDHEHEHCRGGPEAACECMLKCKVFGEDSTRCSSHLHNHSRTRKIVDDLIVQTMLSHESMCDGMRCVTECARSLGCLDGKVVEACETVKKNYADDKEESDPECDLSCDA